MSEKIKELEEVKEVVKKVSTKTKRPVHSKVTTPVVTEDTWNGDKIVSVKISDDLTIKVNPFPTIEEKVAFIKKVTDDSFLDDTDVYYVRTKAIFDVLYILMYTNYQFPDSVKNDDGIIQIESAYNHMKDFDLDSKFKTCANQTDNQIENVRTELWKDVKQRIDSEKAKRIALLSRNFELEEVLENVNALLIAAIGFIGSAERKLSEFSPDNIENLTTMLNNGLGNITPIQAPKPIRNNNKKPKTNKPKEITKPKEAAPIISESKDAT